MLLNFYVINNFTRYLRVHLDNKLTWADYIKIKRKSLNIILHKMRHLKSNLPLNTKLLIYKQIIRSMLTYGTQLWVTVKKSKIQIFQSFQSRIGPSLPMSNVNNHTLHTDFKIHNNHTLFSHYHTIFHLNTFNHTIPLISNLSSLTLLDNPPRNSSI